MSEIKKENINYRIEELKYKLQISINFFQDRLEEMITRDLERFRKNNPDITLGDWEKILKVVKEDIDNDNA